MNKNKLVLLLGGFMVFSMVGCTNASEYIIAQSGFSTEATTLNEKDKFNASEVSHFFEKTKEDVWNVFGKGNLEFTTDSEFGVKSKVFSYPKSDNEEKTTTISVNYETKKIHIINTKTNLFDHVRDIKVGDTAESVISKFNKDMTTSTDALERFNECEDGFKVSLYGDVTETDVLNPDIKQSIGYVTYEKSLSDEGVDDFDMKSIVYRDGGIEVTFLIKEGNVEYIKYADFR